MELTHRFTVPADVDTTWAAFNDIESVAGCFPGAVVTSAEGDSFEGSCKVKLGPIAMVYNGSGTFTEKDASAHVMKIDAKGKDKRGNGTAGAKVTATLTGNGSSTDVEVVTDLAITGKPAQFGRGVMQDVSDKLLGQFVACLEHKVGAPPETAAASEPETSAPSGPAASGPVSSAPADPAPAASSPPKPAAAASDPAPKPATNTATRQATRQGPAAAATDDNEALDLGATVLPILARAYWKQGLAAVAAIVVVVLVVKKLF